MNLISAITIETAWLPPIVINDPLSGSSEPGAASIAGELLKPRVSLHFAGNVIRPASVAPWGDPGASKWPQLRFALAAAGAAVLVFFLARLARK